MSGIKRSIVDLTDDDSDEVTRITYQNWKKNKPVHKFETKAEEKATTSDQCDCSEVDTEVSEDESTHTSDEEFIDSDSDMSSSSEDTETSYKTLKEQRSRLLGIVDGLKERVGQLEKSNLELSNEVSDLKFCVADMESRLNYFEPKVRKYELPIYFAKGSSPPKAPVIKHEMQSPLASALPTEAPGAPVKTVKVAGLNPFTSTLNDKGLHRVNKQYRAFLAMEGKTK